MGIGLPLGRRYQRRLADDCIAELGIDADAPSGFTPRFIKKGVGGAAGRPGGICFTFASPGG